MKGFNKNEGFKMDRKCNMPDHRGDTIHSRFYKIRLPIGKTNVNIYPAAFFPLMSGILGIRNLFKNKAAN